MSMPEDTTQFDITQPTPTHPKLSVNPNKVQAAVTAKKYWSNVDDRMNQTRRDSNYVKKIYQDKVNDNGFVAGIRVDYNPMEDRSFRKGYRRY